MAYSICKDCKEDNKTEDQVKEEGCQNCEEANAPTEKKSERRRTFFREEE